MIHVKRGPVPKFYSSDLYHDLREDLKRHFSDYSSKKRRIRYKFPLPILKRELHDDLTRRFGSKCAFCETQLRATSTIELEQYRPKQGARGFETATSKTAEDSIYLENHYWWTSLDWDNQLISCPECNRFKGTWFPLADESRRAQPPGQEGPGLEDEEPLLLDPCSDDPEAHLDFTDDGMVRPRTEKGRVTIELLNLNRSELVQGRLDAIEDTRVQYEMVLNASGSKMGPSEDRLAQIIGPEVTDLAYLAPRRQWLQQRWQDDPEGFEAVMGRIGGEGLPPREGWAEAEPPAGEPLEAMPQDAEIDFGRLAIEKIELHNFKNIADLTIEMPRATQTGQAPWLVFLGENAVGKSSVIQAITLTLMGDEARAKEVPYFGVDDVLRYTCVDGKLVRQDEGWVRIWVSGRPEPLQLSFQRGDQQLRSNVRTARSFLLAYGSSRLFPDRDIQAYESEGRVRVRNLFRPSAPLVDAENWLWELRRAQPEQFDLMVRGLREMLLLKGDETIEPDGDLDDEPRIRVQIKHETTLLRQLSDGYRTILALACDLMYMLSREGTSMDEAEGVVIIDEIGSNLHPAWKKRIVGCFRTVFPRIQFIVTTHEPLCLRGLHDQEVILLRRDLSEQIVAVTQLPNPQDLRVDQLLMSEYFGLSSTVENDLEDIYEEYYKLLTTSGLTDEQKRRRSELKEELRERRHLGTGLREELMYEVIDELLAQRRRSPRPESRKALKKETLERVLASWKRAGLLDEYLEES